MNDKTENTGCEETTCKSPDGLELYERWWRPEKEPKAAVIIVHGFAEHCARYDHVAEYLNKNGYSVAALDLRGHGRSEGKRSYITSFDKFLDDIDQFLSRVRNREPQIPMFLLGHSMGGTIVTLFACTRRSEIKGILLSGAALKLGEDVTPVMKYAARVISYIFPKLALTKLDSSSISRDPEVVECYDKDPLNYRGGTHARTGLEIIKATEMIGGIMENLTLPVLIMHGTADRLVDPEGSKELYDRSRSGDKTLKLYEGLYHEILNEPEKIQVLKDIVDWLDAHI